MRIKKRSQTDIIKTIQNQCKWCQSQEPETICNGQTFWNIECPVYSISEQTNYEQMILAIQQYCSICQALNHDEDLRPCNIQECKFNQLWTDD